MKAWELEIRDPAFFEWGYYSSGVTQEQLDRDLGKRIQQAMTGEAAYFAVVEEGAHGIVGAVDVEIRSWADRYADVAYWIAPTARGRSLAPRGLLLASRWALTQTPLKRLTAPIHPDHITSKRVVAKAGYRYIGRGHNAYPIKGTHEADFFELRPQHLAGPNP